MTMKIGVNGWLLCVLLPWAVLFCGCYGGNDQPTTVALPRPVSTITLKLEDRSSESRIAGSVAAWKTEQLGFEVAGRVEFVIEPETDILGHAFDENGHTLADTAVTELARVDETRYVLNEKSVAAQVSTLTNQKNAQEIEHDNLIPAQYTAAKAELDFQDKELIRITPLKNSGVVTQAEYDRTKANRDAAAATVSQSLANLRAKKSEIASAEAKILEQNQALLEAKRDVADCILTSSFRGQVAEVHVIPGAYVERGQPVVTVQMTDPIKVEFEASAATTRKLNYSDLIPIHITNADGNQIQINSYLYKLDAVADTDTRTFTVTLLVRNEKVSGLTKDIESHARVDGLRKIMTNIDGEKKFVDVEAIYQDAVGDYIWKVESRTLKGRNNDRTPVIKVSKIRIKRISVNDELQQVQLLGNWKLQQIEIEPGQQFNPDNNLIARKIFSADANPRSSGPPARLTDWDGDTLVLDQSHWLMRPGDLVGVDIADDAVDAGFYVPMNAIVDVPPNKYVFKNKGGIAIRVPVTVADSSNTYKRIERAPVDPVDVEEGDVEPETLEAGDEVIVSGVHYLVDGEAIVVSN